MAKLAQTGVHNEPLLRRTVIDKAVQRVRRLLATISWDSKLTQWLHQLLIDNLDPYYLALYLDILQVGLNMPRNYILRVVLVVYKYVQGNPRGVSSW